MEEIRIKDGYLGGRWPSDDKIRSLVDAADVLFIWASTTCLYIDEPDERLSDLINKQPSSSPCTRPVCPPVRGIARRSALAAAAC